MKVSLTQQDMDWCLARVTGAAFNNNTIMEDGRGQLPGLMAERAFWFLLQEFGIDHHWPSSNPDWKGQYDFLIHGQRLDVKAKRRNYPFSWYQDGHVQTCQKDYECDGYVFASVRVEQCEVSIPCYMPKQHFFQQAKEVFRGDPDGDKFRERDDAYKMPYSQMKHINILLEWGRKKTLPGQGGS